jgi:hypothetical protein
MLNIGSHIRVFLGGAWHHGIYIGRREVIHLSSPNSGSSFRRKLTSHVHRASLERFCGKSKTFQRILEVRLPDRTFRFPQGPDARAVSRARKSLNSGAYDVYENNCEHFAFYCTTGKRFSAQVDQVDRFLDHALDSFPDFIRAYVFAAGKLAQPLIHKLVGPDDALELEAVNGYSLLVEEYRLPAITRGRRLRIGPRS